MQTEPTASSSSPSAAPPAAGLSASAREASSQRLHLLVESTGEGIGVDLHGRCTFISRSGASMPGWRTEQVPGRNNTRLAQSSTAAWCKVRLPLSSTAASAEAPKKC